MAVKKAQKYEVTCLAKKSVSTVRWKARSGEESKERSKEKRELKKEW